MHYNSHTIGLIEDQMERLNVLMSELTRDCAKIEKDVSVIRKYVGFIFRMLTERRPRGI